MYTRRVKITFVQFYGFAHAHKMFPPYMCFHPTAPFSYTVDSNTHTHTHSHTHTHTHTHCLPSTWLLTCISTGIHSRLKHTDTDTHTHTHTPYPIHACLPVSIYFTGPNSGLKRVHTHTHTHTHTLLTQYTPGSSINAYLIDLCSLPIYLHHWAPQYAQTHTQQTHHLPKAWLPVSTPLGSVAGSRAESARTISSGFGTPRLDSTVSMIVVRPSP